jgi:hypothetical protein
MNTGRRWPDAHAWLTRAMHTGATAAACIVLAAAIATAFAGYLTPSALLALLAGLTFCG